MSVKKSELWQRVRAAREFAKLTQNQLAEVYGVKRAAISHHESPDPSRRVNPSGKQLMALGMVTGVPPEYLLSDSVSVDDIYRMKTFQPVKVTPQAVEALPVEDVQKRWTAALNDAKVVEALSTRVTVPQEPVREERRREPVAKDWMPKDVEQLSVLLDMIGEPDTRTLACQAATAAILNVAKSRMHPPSAR